MCNQEENGGDLAWGGKGHIIIKASSTIMPGMLKNFNNDNDNDNEN